LHVIVEIIQVEKSRVRNSILINRLLRLQVVLFGIYTLNWTDRLYVGI